MKDRYHYTMTLDFDTEDSIPVEELKELFQETVNSVDSFMKAKRRPHVMSGIIDITEGIHHGYK